MRWVVFCWDRLVGKDFNADLLRTYFLKSVQQIPNEVSVESLVSYLLNYIEQKNSEEDRVQINAI